LGYNGFMKNTNTYPIRHVAQKTGLTPHLIRAWERRYGAVVPERTPSNRRLYSEEDIERLKLLRRAAGAGHSMAQIAGMSTEALSELMGGERAEPAGLSTSPKSESPAFHLGRCLTKVQQLDPAGLHEALNRAAIALNRTAIIEDVVSPLLRKIGDLWGEGTLKVANEHMATAVIRSFLGELLVSAYGSQSAPRIVVTTPPGEWHEIGALMLAVEAAGLGWQAVYLGPNLPAEEILSATEQAHAKAVALSVVQGTDDFHLIRELKKLRQYLPEKVPLMVGGRAAEPMRGAFDQMGIISITELALFREMLPTMGIGDGT